MNSFKKECIALRKKDKTLNEIVAITGRSKTSVYFHIKDIPLSQAKQAKISQSTRQRAVRAAAARKGKALTPFTVFSRWTPETVLLVSHLIFDGELHHFSVGYTNRSDVLVQRVQMLIKKYLYVKLPSIRLDKRSGVTSIRYGNVELAAYLAKKSHELLQTISQMEAQNQREFIRAFFDDEGCMDFSGATRRIRGYQKDTKILYLIITLLENYKIKASFRKPNEVVITGKENLLQFEREINFSEGVRINPNRTNSRWKKNLEKSTLLRMAIESYQN